MAASGSLTQFKPKVVPVLVQVNSAGKVTSASPAIELSPVVRRLLDKNLDEMINKPAYDHGKPIASQFVINLALQATPREEGNYDAQFAYVSSVPVPIGQWHWVNLDGRRLALAGPNNGFPMGHSRFDGDRAYQPSNFGGYQHGTSPGNQGASHGASSSAAPPSTGK
ncbi:3-deoxy-D-arabinoheptulosonate-7-phosphate synthase [Dyella sp. OK004]|nr:3-deoxy-D-arabinoheptulosonate-7-phosphate synthase [Dyella sp. OK004]